MRLRFIEDRRADYPVTIMCDVLGFSPAGDYAWGARPESQRSAANRDLVDDIKQVHRDTSGRYGSPRIHAELKAQGIATSRRRRRAAHQVFSVSPINPVIMLSKSRLRSEIVSLLSAIQMRG